MELDELQRELKNSVAPVMTAFEEFKKANDENLKKRDALTEEKLAKINETLNAYEGISEKLTLAEGNKKALDELTVQIDHIETALKRVSTGDPAASGAERKQRVNLWARAVVAAHTKGVVNLNADEAKVLADVATEYKALALMPDTAGGYLAPVDYVRDIIKAIILVSPVRTVASVRTTAARSIQIPKRTGIIAGGWVAENGTKTADTAQAYGLEEIPTAEAYAMIDISNQMLEDAAFDMQAEISSDSTITFAKLEGASFVNGSGVGQPEGFMTNASVSSDNSGSAATIADANGQADGLLTMKHNLKTGYAQGAIWAMNRTTLGSVRKLKDSQNRYIWMPGIANGAPNTIDGDPYVEMPDMASEGANAYPIAYGNFKMAYTWVDRLALEMLRDPYTQATSGNIRFVMRKRVGGKVVLAEAVRKLKCSA